MREIEQTVAFKRDLKREAKGRYAKILKSNFGVILQTLADDMPLPSRFRDHALTGDWQGCRDCHIKPDLILIYSKPDTVRLILLRLGSHSELRL